MWFCETTSWTDYYRNEYLTNSPITVTAKDIEVKAGNTLNTYGSKFYASRDLRLEAGNDINYFAVYDQEDRKATRNSKTGWGIGRLFSITVDKNSSTSSRFKLTGQRTELQSQRDILSNSGGNQLLQGTKVSYGGSAAFQAGVGDKARKDAKIILEGIKNLTSQQQTQDANYVVWQKKVDKGNNTETLLMPTFSGPSKPTFSAPGGIQVQVPEGELKTEIAKLSAQPGMEYLTDLAQRKDVDWKTVKLVQEEWNQVQEGLTWIFHGIL